MLTIRFQGEDCATKQMMFPKQGFQRQYEAYQMMNRLSSEEQKHGEYGKGVENARVEYRSNKAVGSAYLENSRYSSMTA